MYTEACPLILGSNKEWGLGDTDRDCPVRHGHHVEQGLEELIHREGVICVHVG